jgi:hypothetical protein
MANGNNVKKEKIGKLEIVKGESSETHHCQKQKRTLFTGNVYANPQGPLCRETKVLFLFGINT